MITVKEARSLINENIPTSKVEVLPLLQANSYILAETVYSTIDTPPFHQSAMDGYAFSFEQWNTKNILEVNREVQAGTISTTPIKVNEGIRIFTGAAMPEGADTVVMQEKVILNDKMLSITDDQLKKGSNVRLRGSQTKKGDPALKQGQLLTPSGISFLAGIGISQVKVFSKPIVSIIVTGKELTKSGDTLIEGTIFESNSAGLTAGLNQLGINPVSTQVVDDNEEALIAAISNEFTSDIIILTGGVSVGDYDLVPASLEKCGVTKVFHKVKQKPGKPFYFGKFKHTLVFALPGNPAAVMSCFYQYVVDTLGKMTQKDYLRNSKRQLLSDYKKKQGLTYFLKGKTKENSVEILDNQESYQMNSFALADCMIELDEEKEEFKKGDTVNVLLII